jgi:hypothetical protein
VKAHSGAGLEGESHPPEGSPGPAPSLAPLAETDYLLSLSLVVWVPSTVL